MTHAPDSKMLNLVGTVHPEYSYKPRLSCDCFCVSKNNKKNLHSASTSNFSSNARFHSLQIPKCFPETHGELAFSSCFAQSKANAVIPSLFLFIPILCMTQSHTNFTM